MKLNHEPGDPPDGLSSCTDASSCTSADRTSFAKSIAWNVFELVGDRSYRESNDLQRRRGNIRSASDDVRGCPGEPRFRDWSADRASLAKRRYPRASIRLWNKQGHVFMISHSAVIACIHSRIQASIGM